MIPRNYTSINNIKNFAINELAPKYFNMDETNDLNIGLLGYTTELVTGVTEDAFNTVTTYMNEIFPNLAILPESIYNYGALFQIDSSFASASECDMVLFIPEDTVIKYATKISSTTLTNDTYEFFLDSNMTINIEDIRFKPDYNIHISYQVIEGKPVFTARYDLVEYGAVYKNSISTISNQYIKLKHMIYQKTNYLQLEIKTHQVDRYDINDNVVDGTIINLPRYTIEFDDYIANFEVFYKAPNTNNYIQLKKKLLGSSPITEPFCYYNATDENKLEISFTSRDNFFQPEYNSEINISYYTTKGDSGNFLEYVGSDIVVDLNSEIYDYNNNIAIFAIPMTGSYNGATPLTLTQLKNMVIEKFSTVGSYTNENDLQLYFNNFANSHSSDITIIKKRDDIFNRLFTAFILMKEDDTNEIYSTNTLRLELSPYEFYDDEDGTFQQSGMYVLKPGNKFKYKYNSSDTVIMTTDEYDSSDFLYRNPFLIYFSRSPIGISYYLNTFSDKYNLDHDYINNQSLIQFICNSISISRNSLLSDDNANNYTLTLTISSTSDIDFEYDNDDDTTTPDITLTPTDLIRVKLIAKDNGVPISYMNMDLIESDLSLGIYKYSCTISTNDYITLNDRLRVQMYNYSNEGTPTLSDIMIPMTDCVLQVEIEYRSNTDEEFVLSNTYSTTSDPVMFIKPLHMIRSTSEYIEGSHEGDYLISIESSPLVKDYILTNELLYTKFYNTIILNYEYIENILDVITNNYNIDIKFYNTYGKSKNFYIDDDNDTLIDRVNISIGFKIHPKFGTIESDLIRDVKSFIKQYIENINSNGTNTFYISNLIRELENNFSQIDYLKFTGINEYSTDVQSIINKTVDFESLTREERLKYVPEYLTINIAEDNGVTYDDINIEIF